MITDLKLTRGTMPSNPIASEVALEASVSESRAQTVINAAWVMVEKYTGRLNWPVTAAVAVAELDEPRDVQWPRNPAPAAVTVETWRDGAWQANPTAEYLPEFGAVLDLEEGRHRLTQVGSVTPDDPTDLMTEAVRCIALYMLIHAPQRREFRSVQAGGDTVTREALTSLFRGSGAGALLAGEMRW